MILGPTIVRVSPGGLIRRTWHFGLVGDSMEAMVLRVHCFIEGSRARKQNRWRICRVWDRRHHLSRRPKESWIPAAEVPFPQDVGAEALERFRERVRVAGPEAERPRTDATPQET